MACCGRRAPTSTQSSRTAALRVKAAVAPPVVAPAEAPVAPSETQTLSEPVVLAEGQNPQTVGNRARWVIKSLLPLLLLLPLRAEAQVSTIDLTWLPVTNVSVTGYKLYKGDTADPTKMTLLATVLAPATKHTFPWTDGDAIKCFALSSYNAFGESPKTTKTAAGVDVCLGKPSAPQSLSWSAQ